MSKKKARFLVGLSSGILVFWGLGSLNLLFGQEGNKDTHLLDPVTITAGLTQQRASQSGRDILIIPGSSLDSRAVHSLDELLRYVPGIEIQSRGPLGAQSDIVMRGSTYQQVLVVIDGLRLNDPNTGHFSSYIPVVPGEIDHIEVLKGASSALYGADAVGGVIMIYTKSFMHNFTPEPSNQIILDASGGSRGLVTAHGTGSWSDAHSILNMGVSSLNSNGEQGRGINNYVHAHSGEISFGSKLSQTLSLSLRSSLDYRRFAAQNFYTDYLSDTAREKVLTSWNQAAIHYEKGENSLHLNIGYKYLSDNYLYSPTSTSNRNFSHYLQGMAIFTHRWGMVGYYSSGIQLEKRSIRSNDRGNHSDNQLSAFLLLNRQLGAFSLSPALRFQYAEIGGYELVPQFNASFKTGKFLLRGNVGKTIRDPDFTELYNNYNKTIVRSGSIGNPGLHSEQAFSYEAGIDYFAASNLKTSMTLFRRANRRLIDWVSTPYDQMPRESNLVSTGVYSLAKNIARLSTTGIEFNLHYDRNFHDAGILTGDFGLTWIDNHSSDSVTSFYVSSSAKFLTNFTLDYRLRNWETSLNGLYKERAARASAITDASVSRDYWIFNFKETYTLGKLLKLFMQVDNLLNRNYSDLGGSRMPGRWFSLGASLNLNNQ